MKKRILELQSKIEDLKLKYRETEEKWASARLSEAQRTTINTAFQEMIEQHQNAIARGNKKKLIKLNGGQIMHQRPLKGFVNLTSKTLSPDQEELLDFGLNCHIMAKPRKFQKRLECEVLLDDVDQLEKKGEVTTEPTFKQEVIAESAKTRGSFTSSIIEKRHIEAARQLKEDKSITIRKADKAAVYVVMNTEEYLGKIDNILNDRTKFARITRDPTESLKKKINKLISKNNSTSRIKFYKLMGEYGLGYCYGNVKTHKPGNKLRPIISQIPTPTYNIAKKLCALLTPYTPSAYTLESATDFLDILKIKTSRGNIASLDVESLFTNVPVDRTINYIINRVYHDNSTPGLDIPEDVLRGLLECCTKEAPFTCPRGNKYTQIDGVAMGSPLGVLFANFFMGCVEEKVFQNISEPNIYCRYIDDIFIDTENEEDAEELRLRLQEISGLTFTMEKSNNGTMPFLDVLVKQDADSFTTDVYVKPTNTGNCLNGRSECPQRYKDSTIGSYIRRALTHCSNWQHVHTEIERTTQVLLSNGFQEDDVHRQTKKILNNWHEDNGSETKKDTIKLYYKAHFSTAYKEEERIIKQIIKRNVKPTNPEKTLSLTIYYRNKKTSHLLLRNSPNQEKEEKQKSHVIYRFKCTQGNCESLPSTYVGMTTMKLTRRLSYHLSSGAPKKHLKEKHGRTLTREFLEASTVIIDMCSDARRLQILEALYIKSENSSLNIQALDLQALPSMRRRGDDATADQPGAATSPSSSAGT